VHEPERLEERRAAMEMGPFSKYKKWADEENEKRKQQTSHE